MSKFIREFERLKLYLNSVQLIEKQYTVVILDLMAKFQIQLVHTNGKIRGISIDFCKSQIKQYRHD